MKKLFVFDWNGTLLDDIGPNHDGFNEALKIFNKDPVTLERYRDIMDFPLIHMYTRCGVHPDEYLSKLDPAIDAFNNYYRAAAKKSLLKESTVELLEYLTDEGFDLMILSNQNDMDLHDQVAERHVTRYFKIISGNQENIFYKTNKLERLQKVIEEHGYDVSGSYIIGNSLEEPELAHRLGLKCFSVIWGCFSLARLEKSATDHIIDDLAEVQKILQKSGMKKAI